MIWTCSPSEKVFLDQNILNVTIKPEIVAKPNHDQAILIIEMNHSHPWDIGWKIRGFMISSHSLDQCSLPSELGDFGFEDVDRQPFGLELYVDGFMSFCVLSQMTSVSLPSASDIRSFTIAWRSLRIYLAVKLRSMSTTRFQRKGDEIPP